MSEKQVHETITTLNEVYAQVAEAIGEIEKLCGADIQPEIDGDKNVLVYKGIMGIIKTYGLEAKLSKNPQLKAPWIVRTICDGIIFTSYMTDEERDIFDSEYKKYRKEQREAARRKPAVAEAPENADE